jgi:hypothetical protein
MGLGVLIRGSVCVVGLAGEGCRDLGTSHEIVGELRACTVMEGMRIGKMAK